ncbi:hypothetical protein DVW12_10020 [Clostridium botulinum]|nr:hypothetical protein [Clostridium botulinum]
MNGIYTTYVCKKCKKENILITEEVMDTIRKGEHVSCSHCRNTNLREGTTTDDLRVVMNQRSYKRRNGALMQKGGGTI